MAVRVFFVEPLRDRTEAEEAPFGIDVRPWADHNALNATLINHLEESVKVPRGVVSVPVVILVYCPVEIEFAFGVLVEVPGNVEADGVHLRFDHPIERLAPMIENFFTRNVGPVATAQTEVLEFSTKEHGLLDAIHYKLMVLNGNDAIGGMKMKGKKKDEETEK